jgi:transcriptional regulator with XRE-family HTH domain
MSVKDLKNIVSKKLTLLLKNSGKTLEATAYALDMPLGQYYRLLKGQCLPLLPTFIHISKVYGLSLDWWFKDTALPRKKLKPAQNSTEYQIFKILKGLETGDQKIVLATVQTLARRLKAQAFR